MRSQPIARSQKGSTAIGINSVKTRMSLYPVDGYAKSAAGGGPRSVCEEKPVRAKTTVTTRDVRSTSTSGGTEGMAAIVDALVGWPAMQQSIGQLPEDSLPATAGSEDSEAAESWWCPAIIEQ